MVCPRLYSRARTTNFVIALMSSSPPRDNFSRVFLILGWQMINPPPQLCVSRYLELGVHAAQQRSDRRAHRLVTDEYDYRDRGEDKRVFGHRLTALIFPHLHKHSRDFVHQSHVLLVVFWPKLALSP